MNEDYKLCPYCNNAVDKKDKQCPYCLKSLIRRNNSNISITSSQTNNEEVNRDSGIKNNKSWNFEIPPLFQKFSNIQKQFNWQNGTNDPEITKKVRKFAIIFFLIIRWIPFIIGIIASIFWD